MLFLSLAAHCSTELLFENALFFFECLHHVPHWRSASSGAFLQAEVQAKHQDGAVMLHTRSTKYGLLSRGQIVSVPAQLVRRQRHHFQHLKPAGVDIILGCNGLVWVAPHTEQASESQNRSGALIDEAVPRQQLAEPTKAERVAVARAAQAMLALAQLGLNLHGDSISKVVQLSLEQGVKPSDMLGSAFLAAVAAQEEIQRQAMTDAMS